VFTSSITFVGAEAGLGYFRASGFTATDDRSYDGSETDASDDDEDEEDEAVSDDNYDDDDEDEDDGENAGNRPASEAIDAVDSTATMKKSQRMSSLSCFICRDIDT